MTEDSGDALYDALHDPKPKKTTGSMRTGELLYDDPAAGHAELAEHQAEKRKEREAEQRRQREKTRDLIDRIKDRNS